MYENDLSSGFCLLDELLPPQTAGPDRSSYVSCSDVWTLESIQRLAEEAFGLVYTSKLSKH